MKEQVLFQKKSWVRGNICRFCKEKIILWEISLNGSSAQCCGRKDCRKKAEKKVS